MIRKFTGGYVSQHFDDDGNFLGQAFIARGKAEWENDDGESIGCPDDSWYEPFDMIQPPGF